MIAVANARMYAVAPTAAAAWRGLLQYAISAADVTMSVVDHPPPAGLPELWARPDLGCVFMCGWPFAQEGGVRPLIAAPVPQAAWSAGAAIYRSDFVVAMDSPFENLPDVLGRRFAFNSRGSHSGWNLPCVHLSAPGAGAFSALIGPFVTHQRAIAAVAEGEADVAAIDSFVLDLLRLHDPGLAARVRVVASTAASPIPLLVGADPRFGDPLGEVARARLRAVLLGMHEDATGRRFLRELALLRFAQVAAADYDVTLRLDSRA